MEYIAHEVAKKIGISVPALHYYEKAGLLPPIERNAAGNRVYSEENIEWLYMIVMMRETGVPIREIRKYTQLLLQGPETIPDRYKLVLQYKQSVEEKIKLMQSSLKWMEAKVAFYQEMMERSQSKPCRSFLEESELFDNRQAGE
ncbi:MerR family transcriptional regulator [Enterococcus casseliflavus]|uniref:MerR family transcriptional regulator n=1 Tax=Enterococcus TaxID=1350 RepID=UPI0009C14269|nr:MerR family transcriptional regulator [Enterococcus innesii]MBW9322064.1 MerR family transcriptional regulator [Enterococcus casseliflavus]MCO5497163.1 MerR family transcriptional regulator [Enterococcus innesii]OQO85092.1 MerR family transcriptional regulator [Enterococcus casseliflavus]